MSEEARGESRPAVERLVEGLESEAGVSRLAEGHPRVALESGPRRGRERREGSGSESVDGRDRKRRRSRSAEGSESRRGILQNGRERSSGGSRDLRGEEDAPRAAGRDLPRRGGRGERRERGGWSEARYRVSEGWGEGVEGASGRAEGADERDVGASARRKRRRGDSEEAEVLEGQLWRDTGKIATVLDTGRWEMF